MLWQPGRTLEDIEKEVIQYAYRFYERNKTRTALALGIAIRTLDAKLDKYDGRNQEAESTERKVANGEAKSGFHVESHPQNPPQQQLPVRKWEKVQKVSSK